MIASKRIALVAVLAALPAFAQPVQTIRPGYWQISNQVSSADPQTDQAMSAVLQQLATLPPEQRQALEQMAAKQGMSLPKVSANGGVSLNACITPEMAARQQVPMGQQGSCTSNNTPVPGGLKVSFSCTNPASSGQGSLRYVGDTGFTMAMTITTSARGAPEQMTVNSSGSWLGATCPAGK
jgi:hypothetical protein